MCVCVLSNAGRVDLLVPVFVAQTLPWNQGSVGSLAFLKYRSHECVRVCWCAGVFCLLVPCVGRYECAA